MSYICFQTVGDAKKKWGDFYCVVPQMIEKHIPDKRWSTSQLYYACFTGQKQKPITAMWLIEEIRSEQDTKVEWTTNRNFAIVK